MKNIFKSDKCSSWNSLLLNWSGRAIGNQSVFAVTNERILIGSGITPGITYLLSLNFKNISSVEPNDGRIFTSLKIKATSDSEISITRGKTTVDSYHSPILKVRFDSSQTGADASEIATYIESRGANPSSELIHEKYNNLKNNIDKFDLGDMSIPEPDSFDNHRDAMEEYRNLQKAAESRSVATETSRQHNLTWLNIDKLDSFNDFSKAPEEYYNISDAIELFVELKEKYENSVVENVILSEISEPDEFGSGKQAIERYEEVDSLGQDLLQTIEICREYLNKYPNLPFESFINKIEKTIDSQEIENTEKIEQWNQIAVESRDILSFLSDVDTTHSSVDADEWMNQIELALEEEYPNVLHPIHKQVENMDGSLWEHSDFSSYSWQEFEDLIGGMYNSMGYRTEVTSDTADMGVDVWAYDDGDDIAIQAKKYQEDNRVGRETLQKLASTLAKGDANHAVVITTSSFTRTAEDYAEEFGSDIEIIDGNELIDMLNRSPLPPPV